MWQIDLDLPTKHQSALRGRLEIGNLNITLMSEFKEINQVWGLTTIFSGHLDQQGLTTISH